MFNVDMIIFCISDSWFIVSHVRKHLMLSNSLSFFFPDPTIYLAIFINDMS